MNSIKLLDFHTFGIDFLNFAKNVFGVRQSSLSMILKKFLIFGKLSLGDSYKKDSYKKVCNAFIGDWSMGRDRVECELVRGTT